MSNIKWPSNMGLRLLAFLLALLLWFFVVYIETGRITVIPTMGG